MLIFTFILPGYLTPAQQALFGTIPSADGLADDADVVTPPPSPSPSPPSSQTSHTRLSQTSVSAPSNQPTQVNYLRAIQRAINTRDGPLFMKSIRAINDILRSLKYPMLPTTLDLFEPGPSNVLKEATKGWNMSGLPKKVLMRIIEETYQRC